MRVNNIPVINIEVIVDHPLLHFESSDGVAASIDLSKFNIPDRPVISKDKEMIKQWMIDDFEGFVEDVEIMCEDTFHLVLVYENTSDDLSHYYNYLTTDDDGNIIARIRLRLRISNHLPKRSKQQKYNRSQELESPKLHDLLTEEEIHILDHYSLQITVNDKSFDSYQDAYIRVYNAIERAVEVIKSNKRIRR